MLLDKGNDENDKYNAPKMESYRDIQTIFDAYKDTGEQFTYVSEPIIATAEYTEKFADLTGDHNPIHVDPNPKFTSRFGSGRIRHGISTVAQMEPEIFKIFNIQQQEEIIAYKYTITYKKPVKIGDKVRYVYRLANAKINEEKDWIELIWNADAEVWDEKEGKYKVAVDTDRTIFIGSATIASQTKRAKEDITKTFQNPDKKDGHQEKKANENMNKMKRMVSQTAKYAAIIAFVLLAGKVTKIDQKTEDLKALYNEWRYNSKDFDYEMKKVAREKYEIDNPQDLLDKANETQDYTILNVYYKIGDEAFENIKRYAAEGYNITGASLDPLTLEDF